MVEWGALSVSAFTEAILNFLSNHQYESTLPSGSKEEVGDPHWVCGFTGCCVVSVAWGVGDGPITVLWSHRVTHTHTHTCTHTHTHTYWIHAS